MVRVLFVIPLLAVATGAQERACYWSGNSDVDWAEAAMDLGYADQAHFVREFRAFSGLTPSEYRRRAPADPNHVPGD